MNNTKIFTGYWYGQLLPGTQRDCFFNIQNARQQMSVKSIIIDYLLRELPVPGTILPPEMNEVLSLDLTVMPNIIGQLPASVFTITGGAIDLTGSEFHIYRPGQSFYNRLFAENWINFHLYIANTDLLRTFFYNYSLIVEIE